ncbi:hypothetical protein CBR_g23540 [Chara braunii]|uniref:NADP-dependent oxidoreductase domain-containing protein n=1 Tax=Chara braunii TaxID=69332 RepID=A0A388L4T6_CHABU|nr:hypothetical protein CBR_g23540 [Chara braunii]|eukprot:GBG77213.1 hypothetical protein CBR_g23540 [Chara braunii]
MAAAPQRLSPSSSSSSSSSSFLPVREVGTLKLPAILNGLWQLSGAHGQIDEAQAVKEMSSYVDAGLPGFDMADHYGPAEILYGAFLQEYRGSHRVYGLTKWVPPPGPMLRPIVEANIQRSLHRMKVGSLDMLQFHWWDYHDERYLDALRVMKALRDEGKIKNLALTNFDTVHMKKILDSGIPIVSNQVAYSVIDTRPEKGMVQWCLQNNVKLLTYGTLLGGLLSDKYLGKPEPRVTNLNTVSLKKYMQTIRQWGGWSLFQELLSTLRSIADKYNISIANVGVRYIADKPAVGAVIIGARLSISGHVEDNLRTFSFPGLDSDDIQRIELVVRKGKVLRGDCGDEYR